MVESCYIQQNFIELPKITGIESSDFLKMEKAVNHKDQPLRIVIYQNEYSSSNNHTLFFAVGIFPDCIFPNHIHHFFFIQRFR